MHALSNYNNSGILIVTPENDLPADQAALNGNFKTLATVVADYVPYTGATEDVDLNAKSLTDLGGLSVNSGATTSLDGGAIVTNGAGSALFGAIPAGETVGLVSIGSTAHLPLAVYSGLTVDVNNVVPIATFASVTSADQFLIGYDNGAGSMFLGATVEGTTTTYNAFNIAGGLYITDSPDGASGGLLNIGARSGSPTSQITTGTPTGSTFHYQSNDGNHTFQDLSSDAGRLIAGKLNLSSLPTGTLASPPSGLAVGDVWRDTTDSSTYPALRVRAS